MAILGKIRQRSFFLILVIGLALFAFVISGAFGNGAGDTGPNAPIGVINGEEIPLENFRLLVDQTERAYQISTLQAVETVWNQFIRNELFLNEFKELGIDAGRDQIEQVVSSTESIITDPQFINEAGFFDFGLFTDFIAQIRESNPQAYESWKQQEAGIIASAREGIYFDLIKSSTGVTSKDAQMRYHLDNDNLDMNYVQIPYSSIPDSLISVSQKEMEEYIEDNAKTYERKATRHLKYVAFLEQATQEDETLIRNELEGLLDDRVEYNEVSKLTETLQGFKSTTNLTEFIDRHSEQVFDSIYTPKGKLPTEYADILYNLKKGEVFGPYKDINSLKISKLLDRRKNGSIRASHILISYQGAQQADPSVQRTKEEAKALANKLYRQVRRNSNKIGELALEYSDGPRKNFSGDLGFFQKETMTPEIYAFGNKNRVGRVGMIETPFGFHVIKVVEKQDLVLLASVSKEVIPSEKTSNRVFKEATQFEMEAGRGDFETIAEKDNYAVRDVQNVAELDENLPGLPEQRNIVQWAFSDDTNEGEVKRFNLSYGGYAIVELVKKQPEGLASINEVGIGVARKIRQAKKAKLIIAQNQNEKTLEDLAAKNGVEVVNALAVNQKSGTLVGAGYEPYIIGAAFGLETGEVSKLIEGNQGVYQLEVSEKRIVQDLEDYTVLAQQLQLEERQRLASLIISALESAAEIEDNRALYY